MNELCIYLFKASVALALFYSIYHIFLQDEKFYNLIRFYLGSSLVLSFTLPLIAIKYKIITSLEDYNLTLPYSFQETQIINTAEQHANQINFIQTIITIYFCICLLMLTKAIYQFVSTQKLIKNKTYHKHNNIQISDDIPSFSFLGKIIISSKDYKTDSFENIIAHERVHVEQRHWIDLLLIELTTILLWFNPFAWMFERAIKQTHELLADEGVIAQGCNIGQYQASILNQIMGVEVMGLANNFNSSITKKRMIMMTKNKQSNTRKLRFLFIIPAVIALLALNLQVVNVAQAQTNEVATITKKSEKVKIEGILLNNDNKPVANYNVMLWDMTLQKARDNDKNLITIKLIKTDSEGKFSTPIAKNSIVKIFDGKDEVITRNVEDFILNGKKQGDSYYLTLKSQQYLEAEKNKQNVKKEKNDKITYVMVEEMPQFPGGEKKLHKWISANLKYPVDTKKGNKNKVYVSFVVNKKGIVEDVKIMRSASPSLDAEAIRVVGKMPKWKPGKQSGKFVNVFYTLPIKFALK